MKPILNINLDSIFIAWLICCLGSAATLYAQHPQANNENTKAFTVRLENRIPDLMQRFKIPGAAVAVIDDGTVIWMQAFGYADLETNRRMTVDTYFRVESISKPVTAWAVMHLVEEGQVELESPVTQYIQNWEFPESLYAWEEVTVGRLLSQTSGLPLGNIYGRYSPEAERPDLRQSLTEEAQLVREAGEAFLYSNTGYNLLELMVEEVTGQSFSSYLESQILVPLGMHQSSFNWSSDIKSTIARGYTIAGEAVPDHVYAGKASGGLFSTIGDIASFVASGMLDADTTLQDVLKPETLRQMYAPATARPGIYGLVFDAYGLGHFIEELPNGHRAVSHGGQGYGWMTHFHSVPASGDGLVILTNSQRSWPFFGHLLREWSAWSGNPGIGMQRIITGTRIIWAFNILLIAAACWLAGRVLFGWVSGSRSFKPFSKKFGWIRSLQLGLALSILAALIWSMQQNYLFIVSVFPSASVWLGVALGALSLAMILTAIWPSSTQQGIGNKSIQL